jgi:hypothetical protein
MYFEQRLFLIPQTQVPVTSSIYSPMTACSGEEDTDVRPENEQVQVVAHPKLLRVKSNSMKVIPRER